jgi:sulfite reductase alpha subunit-like flavoprotein
MTYSTGGHIAIRPFAPKSYIEKALALMNLKGDEFVAAGFNNKHAVEPLKKKRAKMQVSQLLKYLDLTVKPSQKTLEDLSELCQCPPEMFKLRHLSSSAGKGEFEESIEQPGVTVLEILSQYKSIVLSIKQFVEFFPLLKVRYYSISSSPLKESGDVEENQCSITCAKVDYETGTGRRHEGLASGMLSHLKEGDECMGYIHELSSNFRLPTEAETPIIMIGPGTGIAPFMGFLQERRVLKDRGLDLGEAVLFFGCRSASHDFIYEEELKSFANEGVLSSLLVAFSRDDPEKKVYVQDLIAREKELVWRLLSAGAVIYVCGDAQSMAPDVRKAFSKVIAECSSTTQEEADKYLENLQQSNRYLEDVWG